MRYLFTNETDTPADKQIERIMAEMANVEVFSEEYSKLLTYLERLHAIKAEHSRDPVSSDVIFQVAGNLMGMLLIVVYEQKHPMLSKGWGNLWRPRAT